MSGGLPTNPGGFPFPSGNSTTVLRAKSISKKLGALRFAEDGDGIEVVRSQPPTPSHEESGTSSASSSRANSRRNSVYAPGSAINSPNLNRDGTQWSVQSCATASGGLLKFASFLIALSGWFQALLLQPRFIERLPRLWLRSHPLPLSLLRHVRRGNG